MPKQTNTKVKGCKKAGRNKRLPNQKMSAYVRGVITFEQYQKAQ